MIRQHLPLINADLSFIDKLYTTSNQKRMILITGATGILGRVIALELLKKGKNVRACKRSDSDLSDVRLSYQFYTPNADFYFNKIEWVNIDFNNRQSLYNALKGVTEVYHCAAKLSFDPDDYEEVLETGILSTRNLLSICHYMPVRRFLFVSSSAVLHINKADIELQIKGDQNAKKYYPAYLISKYICENWFGAQITKVSIQLLSIPE